MFRCFCPVPGSSPDKLCCSKGNDSWALHTNSSVCWLVFAVTVVGGRIEIGRACAVALYMLKIQFLTVLILGIAQWFFFRSYGIYLSYRGSPFCLSADWNSKHLKDHLVSQFSHYLQSPKHLWDPGKEPRKFIDRSSVIHVAFPEYLLCVGLWANSCLRYTDEWLKFNEHLIRTYYVQGSAMHWGRRLRRCSLHTYES